MSPLQGTADMVAAVQWITISMCSGNLRYAFQGGRQVARPDLHTHSICTSVFCTAKAEVGGCVSQGQAGLQHIRVLPGCWQL